MLKAMLTALSSSTQESQELSSMETIDTTSWSITPSPFKSKLLVAAVEISSQIRRMKTAPLDKRS
jgi:hypothetical protein